MKKFKLLVVAVLCLALLVGCQSNTNTSDATDENSKIENPQNEQKELEKVKVAYNPGTGNILTFIAMEKGYDKEEGIEIELVPFSNSTDALTALQSKKVDIAVSFGTAAPLTYVTKGADFQIIGGYVSGGMPIYGDPEIEYTGLETFVGKKVAVPRMYTPDIVWRGAMMDAGYDLTKDVEIMEFKKPSDVLEAVKSGQADIGIGTNSTYLQSVESGLKTLVWTNDLWDPVNVCCRVVVETSDFNARPEAYKGFMKAFIRAEKVLNEDPDYAVKLNAKYLKLDEDMARTLLLETNQIIEADPKSDGIRKMWNTLKALNYIDAGDINVDDHINIEIYKEALDELCEENPDDEFYQQLQERFKEYNSEEL